MFGLLKLFTGIKWDAVIEGLVKAIPFVLVFIGAIWMAFLVNENTKQLLEQQSKIDKQSAKIDQQKKDIEDLVKSYESLAKSYEKYQENTLKLSKIIESNTKDERVVERIREVIRNVPQTTDQPFSNPDLMQRARIMREYQETRTKSGTASGN